MAEFMGQYKHAIDHKGRTNIPAKFRKALSSEAQDTFVLTRGLEGCLFVYPLDEWKATVERLKALQMTQANARFFVRTLMSNAAESAVDGQGRITIPQHLMELAGLEKESMIIGVLDKIEIWNPNRYNNYIEEFGVSFEEVAESLYPKLSNND